MVAMVQTFVGEIAFLEKRSQPEGGIRSGWSQAILSIRNGGIRNDCARGELEAGGPTVRSNLLAIAGRNAVPHAES